MDKEQKKICPKCKESKSIEEFNKDGSRKDNLDVYCKKCRIQNKKILRRSKNGLIYQIYQHQKQVSKERKYPLPDYTLKELKNWCLNQELFHVLYDNWTKSGYDKNLTPSIDRKNDYLSCIFNNIQLMTWEENYKKSYRDKIEGRNNKQSRAVIQYDLKGNFIKEHYSMHQASRETKAKQGNIFYVCSGEQKTAGGFIWKYAENHEK